MVISFEVPKNVEQTLQQQGKDLSLAAKEAFLIELYRQEKLTHYELGQALDLSRFETDGLLKQHRVTEDLITSEELAEQIRSAGSMRHS